MGVAFLEKRFRTAGQEVAFIWRDKSYSYAWLLQRTEKIVRQLSKVGISAGRVVALQGRSEPELISALLALIKLQAILVPLPAASDSLLSQIAAAEFKVELLDERIDGHEARASHSSDHGLYESLRARSQPGLVLFTSGSSGEPKGAVHDLSLLLSKYKRKRHSLKTLMFLPLDHIGGIDTLFYTLSNLGTLVFARSRHPNDVCAAIERHSVEVLPVTPSFLNLLIASGAYEDYSLESVSHVTYGAELMPPRTLQKCLRIFPSAKFLQKYGATEVGTLRSRSESSDSLWVKIGGEGFSTRVVDGILQIRAKSSMLGYLNAPSPFTDDGWFKTGDRVEVRGEYYRFRGRTSDIINVGGEKVDPTEVEAVIGVIPGVTDVMVYSEENPFLGSIVVALIHTSRKRALHKFKTDIQASCREKLAPYKVPLKIEFTSRELIEERQKKIRSRGRVRKNDSLEADSNSSG